MIYTGKLNLLCRVKVEKSSVCPTERLNELKISRSEISRNNLITYGFFKPHNRDKIRNENTEYLVLQSVIESSHIFLRQLRNNIGVPKSTAKGILKKILYRHILLKDYAIVIYKGKYCLISNSSMQDVHGGILEYFLLFNWTLCHQYLVFLLTLSLLIKNVSVVNCNIINNRWLKRNCAILWPTVQTWKMAKIFFRQRRDFENPCRYSYFRYTIWLDWE